MVDGAAPGVGVGDAVGDEPLVQGQVRELALVTPGSRGASGRCCGSRTGHPAVDAVRLSRRGAGGCCRARAWRWRRAAAGAGRGSSGRCVGGDGEELLEVLAGDQAPSADLDVGQVAVAHLVVQQVAGETGQAAASSTE